MKSKKSSNAQDSVNKSNWSLALLAIPLIVIAGVCGLISVANKDEFLDQVGIVNRTNNTKEESVKQIQIVIQKDPQIILHAEVAQTSSQLRTGLMYRQTLPADAGMLFVFQNSDYQTFWMKNTYIPLDIAFLDEEKKIINISKNAAPLNETLVYKSEKPAKYVIETNALWFERNNVKSGDQLEFSVE